jgi:glycosyltransferase involved in cell wall biosynthesis
VNILYINHYAGSPAYGMEYRPYHMAREWLQQGQVVHMLAADFSHVRARQPDLAALRAAGAVQAGRATVQDLDGIAYHWYATPSYSGNGLGRVKNIWAFLCQVWLDAPHIARALQPDVVIASSTYPMDIWVAHRIVQLVRQQGKPCKLVFEVHDLWPLSPIELGGMSPRHPFIRLCQAAEDYACRHADVVVSMLPKVQAHFAAHGLDLRKLHVVPNGVVEADWLPENTQVLPDAPLAHFLQQQKAQGKTIVGYAGAHGQPNALEYLLDAAKLLEHENLTFVLVGSGLEKAALQRKQAQGHISNVFFFDAIPKPQIPDLLAQLDIAYIGLQNEPLFRFGISPNKLMDYMMAARPIICAIRAGNDPVQEAGCGRTVEPGDARVIAAGIMQLARRPASERQVMGERGRAFVLQQHTYTVLARRFLDACRTA